MWRRTYNMLNSRYLTSEGSGTTIETKYLCEEHNSVQHLINVCKENCTGTWGVAYYPDKYSGITFRFFRDEDAEFFNKALQQEEGGN